MTKLTQKQLIGAIRELKEIKPRKEWVSLIKSQILEPAKTLTEKEADFAKQNIPSRTWSISNLLPRVNYQRRLAYAFASLVFIIIGTFGFAHYTMPGDLLFPVKKITETKDPFQIAYNRSSELVQILKENKTENIAPAVSEFKASISGAAKNLVQNMVSVDNKKSLKDIKNIIKNVFDQCFIMDKLMIDKEEMHHPLKHIIIQNKTLKPYLVDFERCHKTEKPKNVTQFSVFLISGHAKNLLEEKGIKVNRNKIIELCKKYKNNPTRKNLKAIFFIY